MISIHPTTKQFIIALDASQLDTYLKCPRMWYWLYYESLRLSGMKQEAADKGTIVHTLLDHYYTMRALDPKYSRDLHATAAIEMLNKSKIVESMGFDKSVGDHIAARFAQYIWRYRNNDLVPLVINGTPGVELGFSKILYEDKNVIFVVEGRIDLISYFGNSQDGRKCFVDHKSQSKHTELYEYKIQFKTYAWATGFSYGIINYFGLQQEFKEDKTLRQTIISFPKLMIDEWEDEMKRIFWEIYQLVRDSEFIISPDTNYCVFPKNLHSCAGAFDANPCMFRYLDETYNHDMMMSIKNFKYEKVKPWTPWEIK